MILSIVFIKASPIPSEAAVAAGPIQNLWPLFRDICKAMPDKSLQTEDTKSVWSEHFH